MPPGRPALPRCPRHLDADPATCSRCPDCGVLREPIRAGYRARGRSARNAIAGSTPAAPRRPRACKDCGAEYQPPPKGPIPPRCPNCQRAWEMPARVEAMAAGIDLSVLPAHLAERMGKPLRAWGERAVDRARKARLPKS